MPLQSLQFGLRFVHFHFGEDLWRAEDARWRPMRRSLRRDDPMLCRGMGYSTRQGIGVARIVEAKTIRFIPVREIDECKSALRHSRTQRQLCGEYNATHGSMGPDATKNNRCTLLPDLLPNSVARRGMSEDDVRLLARKERHNGR